MSYLAETQVQAFMWAEETWRQAMLCSDHATVPWQTADIDRVCVAWTSSTEWATEDSSACIVKLKNGNYGTAIESEDYTGHG
jgi:hypothetical protein